MKIRPGRKLPVSIVPMTPEVVEVRQADPATQDEHGNGCRPARARAYPKLHNTLKTASGNTTSDAPSHFVRGSQRGSRLSRGGFTMIEIAISLAVIGFALVAIIGILPAGMNVQKENRQETIINQDASVFLNAIRGGEQGLDDLTNYVVAITNTGAMLNADGTLGAPFVYGYTYNGGALPINTGRRIIGLLSTPRFDGFRSNYVVAYVRSLSGLATEKYPQTSQDLRDFSLTYRMIAEVSPFYTNRFDPAWTNYTDVSLTGTNVAAIAQRSNFWMQVRNSQSNFHDLRLTFRYPFQAGRTGNGRQLFRTSVSGMMTQTNDPGFLNLEQRLFFFEPRNYVQVKP